MMFAMYFANPWGLLGLLSLPVIAGIHLYQRRFPPLLVAGAHLWGAETRVQTAGRRRDRLPITATLLLELLAGLVFSLALAQPRWGEQASAPHLVVALDDSASMSAQPAGESSFRETAISRLRERCETLGGETRITLIQSGPQPTLLGSRAMLVDDALRELESWQPRAALHDFHPAWDEAARVAGAEEPFLFLTDHLSEEALGLPRRMDVIAVGQSLSNVAISAAEWTFDSTNGEGRLFVRIANLDSKPARATLTVRAADQTILTQPIDLLGQGAVPLEATIPGGLKRVELTVTTADDGLRVDNTAVLVEPRVRLITVAVPLPAESETRELVERVLGASRDVQPGPASEAQLIIDSASEPLTLAPDQWRLGIGPLNTSPIIQKQAKDLVWPYLIEKQNPLMNGVLLDGVVWGGAQPTDLNLHPLISAGRIPLFGQLAGQEAVTYVMNIDLDRSNLGVSPDWPILLTNLIELRRDALPGLRRWNYRINETIRFRMPPIEGRAVDPLLELPSGRRRSLVRDRNDVVEITGLTETGVYRIRNGEEVIDEFAVNFFDDQESSLAGLAPGERRSSHATKASQVLLDDAYSWLMAFALLLLLTSLLADWAVLRPKT